MRPMIVAPDGGEAVTVVPPSVVQVTVVVSSTTTNPSAGAPVPFVHDVVPPDDR